jgi:outer membrane protein OmpA-like peptidoglycan-associated protein
MLEALKSKGLAVLNRGQQLRGRIDPIRFRHHANLALPMTALLLVAGCSWFEDNSVPAPDANPAQSANQGKATAPAPGEGEAMGSATSNGTAGNTQTADAGKATFPDINSVPQEAPKPTITNLDQAPSGLGADTANAQHTDETLTMPNESAARPEKPTEENNAQAASVEPTAPETPPAPPAVTPEATTPTPTPAPAPETTPAPTTPAQVASVGTPQPGSKPFEPNGPLYLAPGSLSRNPQEASAASAMPTAPTGITSTPMSSGGNGEAVSVDYSALNGLGGGAAAPTRVPAMTPTMPANAQVAGVGQAIGYVYFGNGSSQLSDADRQVLFQVVQLQRIQGGVLRIIGHASQRTGNMDALAQNEVNKRVSLERATAVAQALVGMGVQPMLVQVAAAGDGQTLYSESTPAGEAGNRRAEVYLSQN